MLGLAALAGPQPAGLQAARAADIACLPEGRCLVEGGEYRVHPPRGWDGERPLPVLIHFHGFRESAADVLAREDLRLFADRRGVLLVAPDGLGNTWSYPGSPSQARDDLAFMDRVRADIGRRFPIETRAVIVSGFSQGAAMAWNLACSRGGEYSGFIAIAGTFWRPQPEECAAGARTLMQIHGVADRTVPLEGRPIRGGQFHQGDVFRAMAMMRKANACSPEGTAALRAGVLACEVNSGCASGHRLAFCLHSGGHDLDVSWLDFAWDFVNRDTR